MKPQVIKGTTFPRLSANELVEIAGVRYRASFWNGSRIYTFASVGEEGGKLDWSSNMKENEFSELRIANALLTGKIKRIN